MLLYEENKSSNCRTNQHNAWNSFQYVITGGFGVFTGRNKTSYHCVLNILQKQVRGLSEFNTGDLQIIRKTY